MEIQIVTIGRRAAGRQAAAQEMFAGYCERIAHFCRCRAENYASEEKFLAAMERGPSGARRWGNFQLILLDSRGRARTSEEFAEWLRGQRDPSTTVRAGSGAQRLVFAVGPASGWSDAARGRAGMLLSLGAMTLPHELAAVVLAEQVYRAFTIVEGHPYHLGHAG